MTSFDLKISILLSDIASEQTQLLISRLSENEKLGAYALIKLGRELTKDDLPEIPDNEYSKDIEVTDVNLIKNTVSIKYTSLQVRKYNNTSNEYVWEKRTEEVDRYENINIDDYLSLAVNKLKWKYC